jgi:hypothetical protein
MSETIVLDNTKRATYRQCKAKYFLQHVNGWQPNFGSTAIRYGVCWHGIQEGYHQYIHTHGWPTTNEERMNALTAALLLGKEKWDKECENRTYHEDYKNFNTAVGAFDAYLDFFAEDRNFLKILSTETKFECPIEPENRAEDVVLSKLPPIIFTGRIDLCVEMDYQKWILDFKTTGWRLDEVITKANRSPQLLGYSYAGKKVLDFEPNGCLASFAYIGAYKSKKTGDYGETKYEFRRVPQIFTAGDIQAWKAMFIDTVSDLYASMEAGHWPQSFDNCYQYGVCPYLKLCRQHCRYEDLNFEDFHVAFWSVLEE